MRACTQSTGFGQEEKNVFDYDGGIWRIQMVGQAKVLTRELGEITIGKERTSIGSCKDSVKQSLL